MTPAGKLDRDGILFVIRASVAAFITYLCMYACRKPFTAAEYAGIRLGGLDYKIVLIISQLIGYTLSKYLGIKYISELRSERRTMTLLALMGAAVLMLLLFAVTPAPYNFPFMFLNGVPLGMIWGVVFGYLEGRRSTELLGAVMASSFIISSGIVKGTGRHLLDVRGVSEQWMPLITALLYAPVLLLGVYLLHRLPPPTREDVGERTERVPMDGTERREFLRRFGYSLFLVVLMYVALTVFRDFRDNFAVEFWRELSARDIPRLLIVTEAPVAVVVLIVIAAMILVRDNRKAFFMNILLMALSGMAMLGTGILFINGMIPPLTWMLVSGFCMYLPYMIYHTVLYERWIAFFRYRSNAGFLMYLSDAFGYLGSTAVLLYRNLATPDVSWVGFLIYTSMFLGVSLTLFSTLLWFHMKYKSKPTIEYGY